MPPARLCFSIVHPLTALLNVNIVKMSDEIGFLSRGMKTDA